jgi:acyl carrier protein
MSMTEPLLSIINLVRSHKGLPAVVALIDTDRLREDLGFDSLDLAELTARIEEHYQVDIFATGLVSTVGEIRGRLASTHK